MGRSASFCLLKEMKKNSSFHAPAGSLWGLDSPLSSPGTQLSRHPERVRTVFGSNSTVKLPSEYQAKSCSLTSEKGLKKQQETNARISKDEGQGPYDEFHKLSRANGESRQLLNAKGSEEEIEGKKEQSKVSENQMVITEPQMHRGSNQGTRTRKSLDQPPATAVGARNSNY